jgi:hypothetical protein
LLTYLDVTNLNCLSKVFKSKYYKTSGGQRTGQKDEAASRQGNQVHVGRLLRI